MENTFFLIKRLLYWRHILNKSKQNVPVRNVFIAKRLAFQKRWLCFFDSDNRNCSEHTAAWCHNVAIFTFWRVFACENTTYRCCTIPSNRFNWLIIMVHTGFAYLYLNTQKMILYSLIKITRLLFDFIEWTSWFAWSKSCLE